MSNSQIGMFDGDEGPAGNVRMVSYGIHSEESHYRAHVAYKVQHVYVFSTVAGRLAIPQAGAQMKSVHTRGIETARGFPVPISSIDGIQELLIPPQVYRANQIEEYMDTSTKGVYATRIVAEMMRAGLVALPVNVDWADDRAIQISGTDIIVSSNLRIQVKCDFRGGNKRYGGTGNLFLQTQECNPFKKV